MNEELVNTLSKRLDDIIDRGRHIIEDEKWDEHVEEFSRRAEHIIRNNPVKSVATALITGYLVGKIFSSND